MNQGDDLRQRIADALARLDCEKWGTPVPDPGHELWGVWRQHADAAMAVVQPELDHKHTAQAAGQGLLAEVEELRAEVVALRATLDKQRAAHINLQADYRRALGRQS